jgi:hypothetical protein
LKNGARIITEDGRVTFVFSHIYCSAQKRRKKFAAECRGANGSLFSSASFLITIRRRKRPTYVGSGADEDESLITGHPFSLHLHAAQLACLNVKLC